MQPAWRAPGGFDSLPSLDPDCRRFSPLVLSHAIENQNSVFVLH
jgi:hypothetical protein